jgi:hypothetical protein
MRKMNRTSMLPTAQPLSRPVTQAFSKLADVLQVGVTTTAAAAAVGVLARVVAAGRAQETEHRAVLQRGQTHVRPSISGRPHMFSWAFFQLAMVWDSNLDSACSRPT